MHITPYMTKSFVKFYDDISARYNATDKYDLMRHAGHGDFNTTCTFYLAVTSDLQDRARAAKGRSMSKILARACTRPQF